MSIDSEKSKKLDPIKLEDSFHESLFLDILKMNSQNLSEFIEEQFINNPVVEVEPSYDDLEYGERFKRKLEWLEDIDEENRVYNESLSRSEEDELSTTAQRENTLQEHLISQLDYIGLSDLDYSISKYIVYSLDENGYLKTDLKNIARYFHVNLEKAKQVLKLIQNLDPPGVGARNLRECLKIQLKYMDVKKKEIFKLVDVCLDKLANNDINVIAKELGVSLEEARKFSTVIKSLNPKPGSTFTSGKQTLFVKPDIIVVKFKGYFEVLFNELAIPRISINNEYRNLLKTTKDSQIRKYVSEKIQHAELVIKYIERRNSILINISKSLITMQQEFFNKGPGHLAPLNLKDTAKHLSIDESTLKRAIYGKYLRCSWGTYSFKYFFPSELD